MPWDREQYRLEVLEPARQAGNVPPADLYVRYGLPSDISDPVGNLHQAFMNSPEHRQNILSPAFHELGIGYLSEQSFQGTTGATLWSQEFGTRSPKR